MLKTTTTKDFLAEANLNKDLPIFADIESDGLYINCSLIQLRQNGTPYLIRTDSDDDVELMKNYLQDKWLIWWNSVYDLGTLNLKHAKLDDLWIAFKIAYPSVQQFTLDNCTKALKLGYLYDGIDKKAMQKKGFVRKAYLSQLQLRYAAADVEALELMWELPNIQKVIADNLAYKLAIYAIEECVVWQQLGLPILHDVAEGYRQATQERIDNTMGLLPAGLNPRSPKQVKALLGTESSDKPTLIRLAVNDGNKLAEYILDARKAKNDMSKLNNYVFDKVVGRFSPVGTSTSRFACKGGDLPNGVNLQNQSRDFKGVFGVPKDSGLIMVAADYSTLEIRIAAAIMGEANMYKALMNGEDIHKATASLIYHKTIDEVQGRERSNSKVANFGFLYGMSATTFVEYAFDLYGIKYTLDEAKDLRAKWMKAYPAVQRYHDKMGSGLRKHNLILTTALGYRIKPRMYTDAINAATQGTGGECGRLAIHLMVKKDPRTLEVFRNFLHDAFYLIVPEAEAKYWGKLLEDCMLEAWSEISKSSVFNYHDIPMKADVVYGHSLSELADDFEGGGQSLTMEEMREELLKQGVSL